MGQLIVGIREAEERLAAIGRALQSAYEEEIREATLARDAAVQGIGRAQAMESAAGSLGQTDIAGRISEIIASLRASEAAANQRLSELSALEKSVQLRLSEPELGSSGPASLPPVPSMHSIPPVSMAAMPVESMSMGTMPPMSSSVTMGTSPPGTMPPPAGLTPTSGTDAPKPGDELLARQIQLLARVEELDRVARRWPKDVARLGIQEHVALARLIARRFESLGRQGESRISEALERLLSLTFDVGADGIVGLGGENADWAKVAAEARAQRLALVDARRKSAAA